jgi:hypothetical protein
MVRQIVACFDYTETRYLLTSGACRHQKDECCGAEAPSLDYGSIKTNVSLLFSVVSAADSNLTYQVISIFQVTVHQHITDSFTAMASLEKIQKNLSDIERKLTKAGKIAAKGSDIKLGDAIKLGSKNNAIVSTIKKGIKEYSVSHVRALE